MNIVIIIIIISKKRISVDGWMNELTFGKMVRDYQFVFYQITVYVRKMKFDSKIYIYMSKKKEKKMFFLEIFDIYSNCMWRQMDSYLFE